MNLKNVFLSNLLTSQHHYLTSRHNCPKRRLFSNNVDLSDSDVDLSDSDVNLSDNGVHLSDIKRTSRWLLVALTRYEIRYLATSCGDIFLTSRHNDLTSQH